MKKLHYLPYSDKEKRFWLNNFSTEIQLIGALLGLSPAEIAEVVADAAVVDYVLEDLEFINGETERRTSYKNLLFDGAIGSALGDIPVMPASPPPPAAVPPGVFKRMGKLVQRIKNHPKYNESMGRNLGVIGHEKVVNYDAVKPKIIKQTAAPDQISIAWNKGDMDGVVVYAGTLKVVAGTEASPGTVATAAKSEFDWEELARVSHSPFIDSRLNAEKIPETRLYAMRYFKNDVIVGLETDVIRIVAEVYRSKAGAELAKILK
jgi:hypothetical protein